MGGRGVFRAIQCRQRAGYCTRRELEGNWTQAAGVSPRFCSQVFFGLILLLRGVVLAVRWRGCLFLSFHVFYLSLLGTTARITQTCAWWYAGCREVKVLKCRKRVCSPRSSRRERLAATKRPDCRVEPRFAREEHKRCEIKFNKIIANFDHLIIFRFFFRAMPLPEHLW